jgi:hypothetical protein
LVVAEQGEQQCPRPVDPTAEQRGDARTSESYENTRREDQRDLLRRQTNARPDTLGKGVQGGGAQRERHPGKEQTYSTRRAPDRQAYLDLVRSAVWLQAKEKGRAEHGKHGESAEYSQGAKPRPRERECGHQPDHDEQCAAIADCIHAVRITRGGRPGYGPRKGESVAESGHGREGDLQRERVE